MNPAFFSQSLPFLCSKPIGALNVVFLFFFLFVFLSGRPKLSHNIYWVKRRGGNGERGLLSRELQRIEWEEGPLY